MGYDPEIAIKGFTGIAEGYNELEKQRMQAIKDNAKAKGKVSIKDAVMSQILKKDPRHRNEGENKIHDAYFGIKADPSLTPHQQQTAQVEKNKALSTATRGFYTDVEDEKVYFSSRDHIREFLEATFDTVDPEDEDIQKALEMYPEASDILGKGNVSPDDIIDPATLAERITKKQVYPTQEKYGFTYEKREDGNWHKRKTKKKEGK